jgi:hypothetical protein
MCGVRVNEMQPALHKFCTGQAVKCGLLQFRIQINSILIISLLMGTEKKKTFRSPAPKAFKHSVELPYSAGNFCFNHYKRFS